MNIEIDINTVLKLYKNKVAELEYELIIQIAQNEKLKEKIKELAREE